MENYKKLLQLLLCFNGIEYKIINNTILIKTDIQPETGHNLYIVLHVNRITHALSKAKGISMTPKEFDIYGCKVVNGNDVHIVTEDEIIM